MVKQRNLFSLPSVMFTVLVTLATNIEPVAQDYFDTGNIESREAQRAIYSTLISLLVVASARYSEDTEDNIYTPKLVPGSNRKKEIPEDYIND